MRHDRCPECGCPAAPAREACPRCRYSPARTERWLLGAAAAFLVLAVGGWLTEERGGGTVMAAVFGLTIVAVVKTTGRP